MIQGCTSKARIRWNKLDRIWRISGTRVARLLPNVGRVRRPVQVRVFRFLPYRLTDAGVALQVQLASFQP